MTTTDDAIGIRAKPPPKKPIIAHPWPLLATALGFGAGVASLVYATAISGEPTGLGVGLAFVAGAIALFFGMGIKTLRPSPWSRKLSLLAAVFAGFMAIRSSQTLTTLNGLAASALLMGSIVAYRPERKPEMYLSSLLGAGTSVAGRAAFEPINFIATDIRATATLDRDRTARVALGALLAVPVVLVLILLLGSADALFARAVSNVFTVPQWLPPAALVTVLVAWLTVGAARYVIGPIRPSRGTPALSVLPGESGAVVIGAAALVLAAFDVTQMARVFQAYGRDTVSFSTQARAGFFELSAVTALVAALILVIDWLVTSRDARGSVLRRLYWTVILLTFPVVMSALARLVLYIDAFGLTQLRALTTVGVVWMAGTLLWVGRTVVAGRRERFIGPAIAALVAILLTINVVNFDARIAQVNLAALGDQPLDRVYLSEGLSPDAIPTVTSFVVEHPQPCTLVGLVDRLHVPDTDDLRSWNLGVATARGHLVKAREAVAHCRDR